MRVPAGIVHRFSCVGRSVDSTLIKTHHAKSCFWGMWHEYFRVWFTNKVLDDHNPTPSMYGIFAYIWLICMVNVGKYTMHGSYGNDTFCLMKSQESNLASHPVTAGSRRHRKWKQRSWSWTKCHFAFAAQLMMVGWGWLKRGSFGTLIWGGWSKQQMFCMYGSFEGIPFVIVHGLRW